MGEVRHTGRPAATLVGIITILIIFYIMFLPPETRQELLQDEDDIINGDEGVEGVIENILLSTEVGKLTYVKEDKVDHYIPGTYLEEKKESKTFAEYDVFTISKGIFGGESKRKLFSISDLDNTIKTVLTFQAPTRFGTLKITLNDQVIFEDEVTSTLPRPIELPKEYLRKNNELIFEVTGGFLNKREYRLEDVKVIGTVMEPEKMSSEYYFTISGTELESFEGAYLEFRASCLQSVVGKLDIELNGKTISRVTPACDNMNRMEVFAEDLMAGKNGIRFLLEEGKARIESAKIRVYLEEPRGFTDFFVVEEKEWNEIHDNDKKIILDIEFIDDNLQKKMEVSINGRRDIINQREPHYSRDITSYAKSGNNYIQLLPLTEITVVGLEVRIE